MARPILKYLEAALPRRALAPPELQQWPVPRIVSTEKRRGLGRRERARRLPVEGEQTQMMLILILHRVAAATREWFPSYRELQV